jgi:hypothetical protein
VRAQLFSSPIAIEQNLIPDLRVVRLFHDGEGMITGLEEIPPVTISAEKSGWCEGLVDMKLMVYV